MRIAGKSHFHEKANSYIVDSDRSHTFIARIPCNGSKEEYTGIANAVTCSRWVGLMAKLNKSWSRADGKKANGTAKECS